VGIKEIAEYFPYVDDQTVRKRHIPKMVKANVVFRSKLPCKGKDGKIRRFWQYWTTESLIERYQMVLASKNNGII